MAVRLTQVGKLLGLANATRRARYLDCEAEVLLERPVRRSL